GISFDAVPCDEVVHHFSRLSPADVLTEDVLDLPDTVGAHHRQVLRRIGINEHERLPLFFAALPGEDRKTKVEQDVEQKPPEERMAPFVEPSQAEEGVRVQYLGVYELFEKALLMD